MPAVLAADLERGWLLMHALTEVRDEPHPGLAVTAARVLAEVQVTMVEHLEDLREAGAPDRGLRPTLAALTEVVNDSVELALLDRGERRAVSQALPWLCDQIEGLYATGLPLTLGHGDLHLGNVAAAAGSAVLYDWSDAAITVPALDAALLSRSAGERWSSAVRSAYAEVWRAGYPAAALDRALRLAPLVNTAYQAISYEGIYRSQEPGSRWELGGIVARSLRELARQWRHSQTDG